MHGTYSCGFNICERVTWDSQTIFILMNVQGKWLISCVPLNHLKIKKDLFLCCYISLTCPHFFRHCVPHHSTKNDLMALKRSDHVSRWAINSSAVLQHQMSRWPRTLCYQGLSYETVICLLYELIRDINRLHKKHASVWGRSQSASKTDLSSISNVYGQNIIELFFKLFRITTNGWRRNKKGTKGHDRYINTF